MVAFFAHGHALIQRPRIVSWIQVFCATGCCARCISLRGASAQDKSHGYQGRETLPETSGCTSCELARDDAPFGSGRDVQATVVRFAVCVHPAPIAGPQLKRPRTKRGPFKAIRPACGSRPCHLGATHQGRLRPSPGPTRLSRPSRSSYSHVCGGDAGDV